MLLMNFKISLVSFLLILAVSLIAFAFSIVGVPGSIVDSIWKLIALNLGISLIAGFAYPFIRGVKRGDFLSTNSVHFDNAGAGMVINMLAGPSAVALQNGRVGERIKINFQGRNAEGVIVAYASTFSPAIIRITEMEQSAVQVYSRA